MAKETEDVTLIFDIIYQGVTAVFDNPQLGQYYVAEKDGEILASLLTTFEWSDWRNAMVWWLQSVYVKPEHRQSGIFSTMYHYIKNLVNSNDGVAGIRLYMVNSNFRADKVYRAIGMDGDHYRLYEWMKQ
nr:GNAT family N-acetyltransferase [Bacteroidota bacterium]